MGANKIYLQADFQSDSAELQIKRLNQLITGIGTTSQAASTQSAQSFGRVTVAVEDTQRAVFGLGNAIAALGVVRLGADIFQAADKLNRLQISFEGITGSAKEAAQMMASLRAVSATSPFKFEDIADGARTLASLGMAAGRIPATMKAISAAMGTLGRDAGSIERVTKAIGAMYQVNQPGSRELLKGGLMKENLPVIEMISKILQPKFGKLDEEEIKKLIDNHRLTGRMAADALLEGMAERYEKETPRIMGLVTVQLQKVEDEFQKLGQVIGSDVSPQMAHWLEQVKSATEWLEKLDPQLRSVIETVATWALWFGVATIGWKAFRAVFITGELAVAVRGLGGWFLALGRTIFDVLKLGPKLSEFGTVIKLISEAPVLASLMALGEAFLVVGHAILVYLAARAALAKLEESRASKTGIFSDESANSASPPTRYANRIATWLTEQQDRLRMANEGIARAGEDALATNKRLRETAAKEAPFELKALPAFDATAPIEVLNQQSDTLIQAIKDARKKVTEEQIRTNEEALKRLEEMTTQALERAKAHELGGLAAIEHEYTAMFKKLDEFEHPFDKPKPTYTPEIGRQQLAAARAADRRRVNTEEVKKSSDEIRALEMKAAQERVAEMKKMSEAEVELAKEAADQGLAARASALERSYNLLLANEEKIRTAMHKVTEAEMADKLRQESAEQIRKGFKEGTAPYELAMLAKRREFQTKSEKEDMDSWERIGKFRIEIEKGVIKEAQQLNEQAFQMQHENLLEHAQQRGDLLKSAIDVVPAQTEEEKTKQANAAANAEIVAARRVYDANVEFNKLQNEEQLVALDRTLALELDFHKANFGLQLRDYLAYLKDKEAMDKVAVQEQLRLDQQLNFRREMLEQEAMKRHNEAVIKDQKEVYDQIKSGVDKVWDAMTSRAGTFAQRIGNMLKAAFLDATKSIVTSHISAALTNAFGKGKVEFGGGPLRQLMGAEPLFGKDRMLVPVLDDGTVPVTIKNREQVSATTNISQTINVPAPSTPEAARAMASGPWWLHLGLAMAAPAAMGAAAPTSGRSATAESIQYFMPGGLGSSVMYPEVSQRYGFGPEAAPAPLPADVVGTGGIPGYGGTASFASGGGGFSIPGFGGVPSISGLGSSSGIANTIQSLSKFAGLQKMLGIAGTSKVTGTAIDLAAPEIPMTNYSTGSAAVFNLAPGSMLPGLGLGASVAGLFGARALGTHGPGGLAGGAVLGAGAGLLAYGSLAAMFPSLVPMLAAAGPVGMIAAAGIGAAIGLSSLFIKTADEKVRQRVKDIYGVDITQKNVRMQIVGIAKEKYGGNINLAVASPEVQELVRLYAIATGKNPMGIPRPMYSATLAESGGGGTQLQAVYQGGRIVANPYTGTTTTQYNQLIDQYTAWGANPPSGPAVVSAMYANPGAVAAANAAALNSGNSRDSQASALIEPLTVMT